MVGCWAVADIHVMSLVVWKELSLILLIEEEAAVPGIGLM